jgi:hypothetical protein
MRKRRSDSLTQEGFIEKAMQIHGDRYDYSLVEYVDLQTKVRIICDIHGVYETAPNVHLYTKANCQKCAILICAESVRKTNDEFITAAKKVHHERYDYSLVDYKHHAKKVSIICNKHGIFSQKPIEHKSGNGCPKCRYDTIKEKTSKTLDAFIEDAKQVHGDRYDYSLVDYDNHKTKVKIICTIHGVFEQQPNNHLSGQNCPSCVGGVRSTKEEFITKSIKKQGNLYDYSKVEYVNGTTKVKITCIAHGIFEQTPTKHLQGQGCPKCKFSKGEKEVMKVLNKYGIIYEHEKSFDGCVSEKKLRFDFYLPEKNMCIEYDGEQHFNPNKNFGKEKGFEEGQMRDAIKNQYCIDNGIDLLRIKYTDFDNIESIIKKGVN